MPQVFLGLGSNVNSQVNITAALDALSEHFDSLQISTVYQSESVGFSGSHFLNLVVGIQTQLSIAQLLVCLKEIEDINGRCRTGPKFSPRTIDIDILTYGDSSGLQDGIFLPREEITENAFVLLPLSELAPDYLHTGCQKTIAMLWAGYDKSLQKLWPVSFVWRNKEVSKNIDTNC